MRPTNYNGMPHWERDFWDVLLNDQGVGFGLGFGSARFEEAPVEPYASPYAVGDVLVGEIVDEEIPCITA